MWLCVQGSHSLGYKNSRTFSGPQKHFFKTPAMFKYRDEQQLETIHNSMIAASKLVYTFITVTCNTRMYCMVCGWTRIFWRLSLHLRPHHCLANSRIFQVLEILQTQFQDFPGGVGTLCVKQNKPSMATGERSSWNSGLWGPWLSVTVLQGLPVELFTLL